MWRTAGKALLAVAAGLAVGGCRAADGPSFPPRPGEATADVVVLDNHWHTALIFERADLPLAFRDQLGPVADARYIAIGWGDEGFFRAKHITAGLVAQALFYSRGSVLLVIGFDAEPEEAFRADVSVYRVPASRAAVRDVAAAAVAAFRRDANGHVIDAGPGIDNGQFFAAIGRYAWYHTCNQWTADCIAAGGLPVHGWCAETAAGIETQLRGLPGVRRNGRPVTPWRPKDGAVRQLARGPHP